LNPAAELMSGERRQYVILAIRRSAAIRAPSWRTVAATARDLSATSDLSASSRALVSESTVGGVGG